LLTVYQFKPAFQRRLRPWVGRLVGLGVTANQVTVAAALLCLAYGVLIATLPKSPWPLVLMPVALIARMALNAMDGMLAREFGQKSRLGAMLNELGDVLGDAALYLPLALVPAWPGGLIVIFVVLGALTEMAGVMPQTMGGARSYRGPMGKSDRALVIGAVAFFVGLGATPGWWLDLAFVAAIGLGLVTVANRVRDGLASGR